MRTSMSCVGAARCEQSCYDEARAHRQVINTFLDDIHRPALPYKFKFKFSGCANDCMNSIQRSDMAVIGTWRDNMRTDEELARKWFAKHGMNELVNDVISRCPTKTIMLTEKPFQSLSPPAQMQHLLPVSMWIFWLTQASYPKKMSRLRQRIMCFLKSRQGTDTTGQTGMLQD